MLSTSASPWRKTKYSPAITSPKRTTKPAITASLAPSRSLTIFSSASSRLQRSRRTTLTRLPSIARLRACSSAGFATTPPPRRGRSRRPCLREVEVEGFQRRVREAGAAPEGGEIPFLDQPPLGEEPDPVTDLLGEGQGVGAEEGGGAPLGGAPRK